MDNDNSLIPLNDSERTTGSRDNTVNKVNAKTKFSGSIGRNTSTDSVSQSIGRKAH